MASTSEHSKPLGQRIPAFVRDSLSAGVILLVVALVAIAMHKPWLFPSYGPTAYVLVLNPHRPASRLYNVIVGHLHGLAAGFLALAITGALSAPSVFSPHMSVPERMWACPLAIIFNVLFGYLLRAHHPPSAATTLIVTLGNIRTLANTMDFLVGLFILTIIGETVRCVRLGRFDPGITPASAEEES